MKKIKNLSVINNLLALVCIVLMASSQASETDFSQWKCALCPDYSGWSGDIFLGFSYADQDDLHFADFRGVDEQGAYLALDGRLHYQDKNGYFFNLNAHDLGLETRQIKINGGHQGQYEYRFGWNEISKYRGYDSQTPFSGIGTDFLSLPTDWVTASGTDQMTQLNASLQNTRLKLHRKIFDAGVTWKLTQNWEYQVDYQKQKKNGTRPFSAGLFFNNASQFPAPVDFTTNQINMGLSWLGNRGQLTFGLIGSWFDNANNSITWENPFSANSNNQQFRAALEPDNKFYQFNLKGAYVFSQKLKVSGNASVGEMQQNDRFIPYSINPIFSGQVLPRASLDGEVDATTYNFGGKLSARLSRKLTFNLNAKLDERDNKTPVDLFKPVITDLVSTSERFNRPYSYDKEKYSADLLFRAHKVINLTTGVKYEFLERTLQAVENSKETTLWSEIKLNPSVYVQGRIKYENADRNISNYLQPDDGGSVDHPLLRKFNQADRDRNQLHMELNIYPLESLGINLNFYHSRDEYQKSVLGLQKSDEENYTIDLNYAAGSKLNLYAFAGKDDIDAQIANATSVNANPWNATTKDGIITTGFGLTSSINKKAKFGIDYTSSLSKGEIQVQTTLNEAPFSPLRTQLKNARIHFDYQLDDHWGYKFFTEYERYDSKDWAIDGIGVDDIRTVLSFGTQSPNYNAWVFRLQAHYRF